MQEFFVRQLDYVFFIYGFSFVFLAAVCLRLARRRVSHLSPVVGLPWVWLSLFGLLHGLHEWLDMVAIAVEGGPIFALVRLLLLAASFGCLLEFGSAGLGMINGKTARRWLLGLLVAVALLGGVAGPSALDATVRYALGFVGAGLAGTALVLGAMKSLSGRRSLLAAGVVMLLYAVAAGLIVPRALFMPALVLNQTSFVELAGFPIQVLRASLAMAIGVALWIYQWQTERRDEYRTTLAQFMQVGMVLMIAAFLAVGWYVTEVVGAGAEKAEKDAIAGRAQTVAALLNPARIMGLTATPSDTSKSDYIFLFGQLVGAKAADPRATGLYLLVSRQGRLVYAVGSAGEGARGYLAPGTVYASPPAGADEALTGGNSIAVGPYPGPVGPVVSGLVPVGEIDGGKAVAVVRYDIDASQWYETLDRYRLVPIGLTLFLGLVIGYFMMDRIRLRDLAGEASRYEKALLSLAVAENADIDIAVKRIAATVADNVRAEGVTLWRYSSDGSAVTCFDAYRRGQPVPQWCTPLDKASYPAFFASLEKEHMVAADNSLTDRRTCELTESYLNPFGVTSLVAVMLARGGRPYGLMNVEHVGRPRKWTPQETAFAGAAAQLVSLALETADRHAAEKAAVESQKRTADIIDFLPDAIFVIDREGRVIAWNKAIEAVTGVKSADVVGKGNYEHALAFRGERVPSLADYVMSNVEEILARYPGAVNRGGVWFADVFLPRLHGGMWMALAAGLLRDEEGKAVGAIESLRDITSVKQTEEALRKAKENAEKMNRQLEQAMSHANRMAIEAALANESKSAFLATMSHEIRTPMNGIIGMTGLLLDTQLAPEQRQYAETVRASADALLGIINDILDFSKIEAGRMELEAAPFSLLNALEGVIDILAVRAHEKGLELNYLVGPEVPEWLEGDAGRLRQTLTNLVGNAVKFTHKGEVVVRVDVKERRDAKVVLRFQVRDTGIGIPKDKIGTLFKPFSQVDASTTRKYGGTGLGLSIAKSLAEAMGGEIGVESEEGIGSTFWFTVTLGVVGAPPPVFEEVTAEVSGAHILVVDDNETNRQLLSRMLELWHCRYDTASGGAEGLEKLQKAVVAGDPFAVVMTDMMMPEMDGEELGRRIKAAPVLKDALMIMMTSFGRPGDAARLQEIGFAAYLAKPLKQAQVRETLARVLGKKLAQAGAGASDKTAAAPPVGRLRILVAEDNITSQKVAQALLAKMGHHSDAVANGLEAVRALETVPYDMVLMDIQMPEMDGMQAARIIRDPASKVLNHCIPIIALTAFAMKGDQERFLAAGMDDYVTKPVDPGHLAAAIQRQAGAKMKPVEAVTPAPIAGQTAAPVFDREGVLKRFGGDEGLLKEIVNIYLEDAPARIRALREALGKGDVETVHREGHTLKGGAANVGAMAMREVGYQIEMAGRDARLGSVPALLDMAERAIEEFRKAVKKAEG